MLHRWNVQSYPAWARILKPSFYDYNGGYISPTLDVTTFNQMAGVFVGSDVGSVKVQVSSDGLAWTDKESFDVQKQLSKRYVRTLSDPFIRFYSTVPMGATLYFKEGN